mmetsp:Transcript_17558/g.38372  ORF Transcript_17558/g.38372 Transcript_17558/m.38372 type:complete len:634 (+) Transcript_17558:250-2151(+)
MYDSSKKRSRCAQSCSSSSSSTNANSSTKGSNRRLFSAAVLALTTLVVNCSTFDSAAVVAFTPTSIARAPLSSNNNNNIENLATRIYPSSNNRRQARQQVVGSSSVVSSTAINIDDDSTTTVTARKRSSSTSSHQRRNTNRARVATRTTAAKNVVVLDDDDQYFNLNNNQKITSHKNGLAVQVVLKNDILGLPSKRSTTTSRNRTRNHSHHNAKMTRPKSRIGSSSTTLKKKGQLKKKKVASMPTSTSTSALLTRDEERQITYKIRDLRRVVRIRDELIEEKEEWSSLHPSFDSDEYYEDFPTEDDWARACDLEVSELLNVMDEGQEARSLLVSANAGLVTSIAKRHYHVLKQMTNAGGGVGTILTLQDMIQEGNLGLMKAAERFEPERGWRFSTYATYWIRQRILQSITDTSRVIRLPAHVTATLQKFNKARKEMAAEIGRMPSDAELAHYMEIPVDKLRKINEKSRSVVSLESPLRTGSNHKAEVDRRTIGDFIASDAPTPEEDAQQKSLQRDIRAVVNELADREREVLILRFGLDNGDPMSTSQTATQLGITTDRVRYIEARALNKLRSPQRNYRLKDYLAGEGHHVTVEKKRQPKLSGSTAQISNSKYRRSNQSKRQKKPSPEEKFWFF